MQGLAGFSGEAAADLQGNFMVVASRGGRGIFASLWSRRDPRPRSLRLTPKNGVPDVAAGGFDNFIVAWAGAQGLVGQRYSAAGQARGSGFQIAPGPFDLSGPSRPAVAANGQGRFVVAWARGTALFARFYNPAGEPRTGPVLVAEDIGDGFFFDVAMDAEGKVLVAWSCCFASGAPPAAVFARRFEASGAPAGGAFRVSPSADAQGQVAVAAGPKDHFAVVWDGGPVRTILGRRLAWARPGADPCLFGGGAFACDAAHDGGDEEVLIRFGGGSGGFPLLGDLDGDGRDDPCVYRDGSFLCARPTMAVRPSSTSPSGRASPSETSPCSVTWTAKGGTTPASAAATSSSATAPTTAAPRSWW